MNKSNLDQRSSARRFLSRLLGWVRRVVRHAPHHTRKIFLHTLRRVGKNILQTLRRVGLEKAVRHGPWYVRRIPRHLLGMSRKLWKTFRATMIGLHVLRIVQIVLHPLEYFRRRTQATRLNLPSQHIFIDRRSGYRRFDWSGKSEVSELVALCRLIWQNKQQAIFDPNGRVKDEFLKDLLNDALLREHPQLVNFALRDEILNVAIRYLGTIPVLRTVGLLFSTPRDYRRDSMLLHKDPEDFEQIKLFLNVFDIDERHGPFTFLPADVSVKVMNGFKHKDGRGRMHRRYSDVESLEFCDRSDFVSVMGPTGSGTLVDTCRCLHFGSRVSPGSFRLVYYVQFCRFHHPVLTSVNRFDRERFRNDPVRWQALTPSRRY